MLFQEISITCPQKVFGVNLSPLWKSLSFKIVVSWDPQSLRNSNDLPWVGIDIYFLELHNCFKLFSLLLGDLTTCSGDWMIWSPGMLKRRFFFCETKSCSNKCFAWPWDDWSKQHTSQAREQARLCNILNILLPLIFILNQSLQRESGKMYDKQ